VLWRRYYPEEKTPGETEGREKEDETGREGGNTPGGLPRYAEIERIRIERRKE
jgi:hypothetical protein